MNYRFFRDDWGADFKVPACVVSDYLKLSDGNYIKVLLCILAGKRNITTDELSKLCGLSAQIVDDAVVYWCGLGVISNREHSETAASTALPNADETPKKFSKRNEPVSLVEAVRPTKNVVDRKIVVNYTQCEIKEKAENDANLKQLINDIQSTLQFSINGKELGRLVELYELYKFDVPTILLAAEYCNTIGKRSIAYLSAVMVRWFEENITTYSEVEQAIIRAGDQKSFENKVLKIFGMESKPSKQQSEYIAKWNNIGFSVEMIEIAYNKCMDTKNKLNFKYIDGILMNWSEGSIKTPEQVYKSDEQFRAQYAAKKQAEEIQKDTSYDLDEFEEFAMNFSLSKKNAWTTDANNERTGQ